MKHVNIGRVCRSLQYVCFFHCEITPRLDLCRNSSIFNFRLQESFYLQEISARHTCTKLKWAGDEIPRNWFDLDLSCGFPFIIFESSIISPSTWRHYRHFGSDAKIFLFFSLLSLYAESAVLWDHNVVRYTFQFNISLYCSLNISRACWESADSWLSSWKSYS